MCALQNPVIVAFGVAHIVSQRIPVIMVCFPWVLFPLQRLLGWLCRQSAATGEILAVGRELIWGCSRVFCVPGDEEHLGTSFQTSSLCDVQAPAHGSGSSFILTHLCSTP